MFNKLVKGFVVGIALMGSLTMVGCDKETQESLEDLQNVELESSIDEDEMKGFVEPDHKDEIHIDDEELDPQTKAMVEEILNAEYLDCVACGAERSICERRHGMSLYDMCGYCFAVYEEDQFTGKYACHGNCERLVDDKLEPIDGEGTVMVCDDCYNEYHTPKVNENLDENGRLKNDIPEIEEVEELTKDQAYKIILNKAIELYGNVEVDRTCIGYNGSLYYANVVNPETREILANIKVDNVTGEIVEVVE